MVGIGSVMDADDSNRVEMMIGTGTLTTEASPCFDGSCAGDSHAATMPEWLNRGMRIRSICC